MGCGNNWQARPSHPSHSRMVDWPLALITTAVHHSKCARQHSLLPVAFTCKNWKRVSSFCMPSHLALTWMLAHSHIHHALEPALKHFYLSKLLFEAASWGWGASTEWGQPRWRGLMTPSIALWRFHACNRAIVSLLIGQRKKKKQL